MATSMFGLGGRFLLSALVGLELVATERRRDPIHLNEDGAREWSRRLAQSLAAWLDARS